MNKPNFFIVGMPRAGTTSLHKYLGEHPDIFMSYDAKCGWNEGKEPHFFASDLTPVPSAPRRLTAEEYLALFSQAKSKILGESSAQYLISKRAAEGIYALNPDTKILVSLRNPVDQCHSLYSLFTANDFKRSGAKNFTEAMEEGNAAKGPWGWFYEDSFYKKNIQNLPENIRRYQKRFGEENVKIVLFDDLQQAPAKLYKEILEFLGVDPDFAPDFTPHHTNIVLCESWLLPLYQWLISVKWLVAMRNRFFPRSALGTFFQRKAPRQDIAPQLRKKLLQDFIPVIEELEAMTGRDLSAWKVA